MNGVIVKIKYLKLLSLLLIFLLLGCKTINKIFYTDPSTCIIACKDKIPYDVIIVPGFPCDSGKINSTLMERIIWAKFLLKRGYTKAIIFSGAAVYTPYTESVAMKQFAIHMGIPPNTIYTESKAEHSIENLYYGVLLAEQLKMNTIAFASHPAQCSFLKQLARKYKLKVDFLPIVKDSCYGELNTNLSMIANEAFVPNFRSLAERKNIWQRRKGTKGKHLKRCIKEKNRALKVN